MGDDVELYWEMQSPDFWWGIEQRERLQQEKMEHDPLDMVEGYHTPKKRSSGSTRKKNKIREKKKNTALFIDGENISHKKAEIIQSVAKKQGELQSARVYGLQKDKHTKGWSKKIKESKECTEIKDIRLCGDPEKDKVDKKIKKDIHKEITKEKNVDIVCIATSDKGFVDTIRELRKKGKRVVVIGEDKAPDELKNACNKFIEV